MASIAIAAPVAPAITGDTDRLGVLDAVKGIACLMIVCHHLAFYGPMAEAARPLAPALIDWFAEYARMAVQVFLVAAGFLVSRSIGLGRWPVAGAAALIGRRYLRLIVPYAVALMLAMLAADFAREWMDSDMTPGSAQMGQLLAHLLLLHDLLGLPALSAGVWYVAIDLQLFALTIVLCTAGRALGRTDALRGNVPEVWLVAALTAISLLHFNRDDWYNVAALYFAGAYGLGMLAGWSARAVHPRVWLAAIAALGLLALAIEWRDRIAVALVAALALGLLQQQSQRLRQWKPPRALSRLGHMSYAVFLVHFPVCLAVNAFWAEWWPVEPVSNAIGLVAALGLSLLAGGLLHRLEAALLRLRVPLALQAVLLASGVLLMGIHAG